MRVQLPSESGGESPRSSLYAPSTASIANPLAEARQAGTGGVEIGDDVEIEEFQEQELQRHRATELGTLYFLYHQKAWNWT